MPSSFFVGLCLLFIIIWIFYTFFSTLLTFILSQTLGASVGFHIGRWNCLRDVALKFKKGAVESVYIGEIKLSLCWASCFSLPKLQVLLCDLKCVLRSSNKSHGKTKRRKSRSSSQSSGKRKWMMVVANIARYLSLCVRSVVLKTPKVTVEIKELNVDVTRDCRSQSNLFFRINLGLIHVHQCISGNQSSDTSAGECSSSGQSSIATTEMSSAPFVCEQFSILCEFGCDREVGITIKNVGIAMGEVAVNLNEDVFLKRKSSGESFPGSNDIIQSSDDSVATNKLSKNQKALAAISKYAMMFPEKVSFNLPKLDVKFGHREHGLSVENNVIGMQLETTKFRSASNNGDCTRLDFKLEFSEIHLLREVGSSFLELLKLDVVLFAHVPVQPILPVRAETKIKLGGTKCNILLSMLKPWVVLHSAKKKRMVLGEEASKVVKPQSSRADEKSTNQDIKTIVWTCNFSAPDMTLMLFNMAGSPVYHGCLQSLELFANNVNAGTTVNINLGELNLHLADEYEKCMKEGIFDVESSSDSIMHIAKVSLDWGKNDTESSEDGSKGRLGFSVLVTHMAVYLTLKRVESLVSTALSFQALLKNLSGSKKRSESPGHSSKSSGKGIQMLKVNFEYCSLYVCSETGLENTSVSDPKRVNYGSQGGRVIISMSADGTPRNAQIMSTIASEYQKLKFSVSLEIFHLTLCVNKEKQSKQLELERARSIYQEYMEESRPVTKVALFEMQNSKFVQRSGGHKEIAVFSLFSATDITVRWEPDVHLSLIELVLQLKLLVHNRKLQELGNQHMEGASNGGDAISKSEMESGHLEKKKKKENIFAIDVELLNVSAELGDGVDASIQIQSIFSENARIGVLLEGLMFSFNGARIFKSSRTQISRIPRVAASETDAKGAVITIWDFVIQGLHCHVCMPHRLELRAIDDALEDMLRALKLIIAAKTNIIFPVKKESSKVKKPSSNKLGCIKFCIRKLTADIEEEPIQGWLDEHYQLLKKEASELAVRLNFLDEYISKAKQGSKPTDANNSCQERKIYFNDIEIDMKDSSTIQFLREEMYKQSFQSYYKACQNLVLSEGSGACRDGFQAGFKPSTSRGSLLTICLLDLNLSLTEIDGGDDGMIEVLKELDPICRENDIPFSRLYGGNILLNVGSLVANLRNYTLPLFSGSTGKCEGCLVLAQQATCFQPQISQDVYVGRWRKVSMLRSASGTTPPMKTYMDLPIHFQKGEASFGVGHEPVLADVSYAFTVALRRANLSVRNPGPLILPPKKEKSLPWWDDMRNYIHGKSSLCFSELKLNVLASTDPYEEHDKLQVVTGPIEIHQSDGRIFVYSKDFKVLVSSLESLANGQGFQLPAGVSGAFLEAPVFTLEVTMDWGCDSGTPLNHYLFALPVEGKLRDKVFDPFRSTSLSLRLNFSLKGLNPSPDQSPPSTARDGAEGDYPVNDPLQKTQNASPPSPTVNVGAYDLAWITKFWNLNFIPPHKLRMFSRFPRFGIPRFIRSGNLSLDRVMTEFMIRLDATPTCIKHMPFDDDDPAKGLTVTMTKMKFEHCSGRGRQKYTFESKRDILEPVYLGIDLHMPQAFLSREDCPSIANAINMTQKSSHSASVDKSLSEKGCMQKSCGDGFLLSSDYFTIRKQSPKADPVSLLAWQEAGRKNVEKTNIPSRFENGGESEHMLSDPSDDDGYNVIVADNCQRVFVYGLKLLWNIENRDAILSFVGGLSKAFGPPKPSPSRQYAQRRLLEGNKKNDGAETYQSDDGKNSLPGSTADCSSSQDTQTSGSLAPQNSVEVDVSSDKNDDLMPVKSDLLSVKDENKDDSDGTRHFMVNVIEPQFNLHSEDANGRFLLAAASGRVLSQSFHSVLHVGSEMIEQAIGTTNVPSAGYQPEMTWYRMEISAMLEHVQAHVAPTDVDPGAGVQWLPKIRRGSPKVMRTGALLERVFMPCDMYFRYTRHKGATPELKVKPLKEVTFNSHNITATMTSRQFQVMLDVLTNLLFARLPKPRKSSLSFSGKDDEDVEEETDEVIPDGIEEVELAKINLEQKEREQKLILGDIRKLSFSCDASGDSCPEKEGELWMIACGRPVLVQGLKRELVSGKKSMKAASASLRMALQKAAQQQISEKEKSRSPSYAMHISFKINKVGWSMLLDGKSFAEFEISDMIYDFDRDYKDVGVSRFTVKCLVIRNCLPNAKCDMLLSAWNPPPEWGKKVMLRLDARQGAPKDGNSPFELFQVEIYPLKIHLTETIYRMMWGYFFPEDGQDSQRRQEVWKVSTTAGARRLKKGLAIQEVPAPSSHSTKESEIPSKSSISAMIFPVTSEPTVPADSTQASKLQNVTENPGTGSTPELRRTSSFDRTWEETVAESVANELVLESISSSNNSPFGSVEQQDEVSKNSLKDSKVVKTGRSCEEKERKVVKSQEEKRSKPRKVMEFHNIRISQVELLVTYDGSPFVVSDLKLLMDQFHRVEFTGTWPKLFSRVKKHIIWGVLKSVTGMQGKKFKDKSQAQPIGASGPEVDYSSDNEDQAGKSDQYPFKRPSDGAGDGFVTSVKGLFNTQRRKAKAFVLRTMRGEEDVRGDWSESDVEFSPYARQLTITKAKKLIRRHTKKFQSKKGLSAPTELLPSSPRETAQLDSDSSSGSPIEAVKS
ncbi:protein SABRE [Neltuma alba]|uniref:protein SABRE n=1 Tax=Neltuma alba TaxID=207710 RepID=UPI0010A39CE0|nr:protein SABRE-like [Prosopis alba]